MSHPADLPFFSLAVTVVPPRRHSRWSMALRHLLARRSTSYSGGGKALAVADFVEPLPRVLVHHIRRSLLVRDVAALASLGVFGTMLAVVLAGA